MNANERHVCECGHSLADHLGSCRRACGCREFVFAVLMGECGHEHGTCGCRRLAQACPSCGALVDPSEAEPDALGVFAAYDHCGVTWTYGWDGETLPPPAPRPRRRLPFRRVWDRDGWECVRCGTHRGLTVDHIIPVSKGGTDDLGNLQTMCFSCNSRKGNRD